MCWLQELVPLGTLENKLVLLEQPQTIIPSTHSETLPSPWAGMGAAGGSISAELSLPVRAAAQYPSENHIF